MRKTDQGQILKTALSNCVLQDLRQQRIFSQRDLRDLFSLKADNGSCRTGSHGVPEPAVAMKGVGQIDPIEETSEDASADNEATLRSVAKARDLLEYSITIYRAESIAEICHDERNGGAGKSCNTREATKALSMSLFGLDRREPKQAGLALLGAIILGRLGVVSRRRSSLKVQAACWPLFGRQTLPPNLVAPTLFSRTMPSNTPKCWVRLKNLPGIASQ